MKGFRVVVCTHEPQGSNGQLSSYKIGEHWKINEISGYEYLLDYELDIIYSRYQNKVRENH